MANKLLIQAVNDNEQRSKPISVYYNGEQPQGRFVLRLDDGVSNQGAAVTRLGNLTKGLIATHSQEWINEQLKGYRYRKDGVVYIVAEAAKESMPSVNNLFSSESF